VASSHLLRVSPFFTQAHNSTHSCLPQSNIPNTVMYHQPTPEFQTILQWSLATNVVSLFLFLLGRRNPIFLKSYDCVKYLWVLQAVVPLLPQNSIDARAKVIVSYGFGFDFKLLEITATSVSAEAIAFRFVTNLVHHLTLLDTTTNLQGYVYALCWLTHSFPWLQRFNRMDLFKRFAEVGNFAPVFAFVWLVATGDIFELSTATIGILFMMVIFRGLYINCSFHVLSDMHLVSKDQEAAMKPEMKKLVVFVSLAVVVQGYFPSATESLMQTARRSILVQSC
jgi:hypothetical protein